jgi:hypothetical protein
MKIARLSGLLLVAILAMSLLSVATASAGSGNPLFNPAAGQSITGTSGVSTLSAVTGQVITCQKDNATGVVTSSLLAGNVFVHYLECTSKLEASSVACTVKSIGATGKGLILTKELHGILGLLLPSLETGILFLPISGKIFVEIEAGEGTTKCTPADKVTGSVAGLVTPVGKKQATGEIRFLNPPIKAIDLTHGLGLREPELVSFTSTAILEQTENVTFGVETEVT